MTDAERDSGCVSIGDEAREWKHPTPPPPPTPTLAISLLFSVASHSALNNSVTGPHQLRCSSRPCYPCCTVEPASNANDRTWTRHQMPLEVKRSETSDDTIREGDWLPGKNVPGRVSRWDDLRRLRFSRRPLTPSVADGRPWAGVAGPGAASEPPDPETAKLKGSGVSVNEQKWACPPRQRTTITIVYGFFGKT